MKLGAKIAWGFGVLIAIAAILGAVGVAQMGRIQGETSRLAQEYIPDVTIAAELRAAANRLMVAMRGYVFTRDPSFYEEAQKEIQNAREAIAQARELQERSEHIEGLKEQVDAAARAVDAYGTFMKEIAELAGKMAENKAALDAAAEKYMAQCKEFLAVQGQAFQADLTAAQKRIEIVNEIVNLGVDVRETNFKGQATNNIALIEVAIDLLNGLDTHIEALRATTQDREDIQRMDEIASAAKKYAENMTGYIQTIQEMDAAREKMEGTS